MPELLHYFSTDSVLQSEFPAWKFRQGQLRLAQAIESALKNRRILLAEAGTGTGKTLAYLLPALLGGKKMLISTYSKHLQDQLADRDVPALFRVLNITAQVAKLKGRQNYICVQRLNDALRQSTFLQREDINQLKAIQLAVNQGVVSERGDMPSVSEDSPVWQYATARTDQCLGAKCPEIRNCHTAKAKEAAMMADIVVVNHHLLCADIAMRKRGFEHLLPESECVIIDEAHQIAAVALGVFGDTWSSRVVLEWTRLASTAISMHSTQGANARAVAHTIQVNIRALLEIAPLGRFEWQKVLIQTEELFEFMLDILHAQQGLNAILETVKGKSPELENLFQRGIMFNEVLTVCTDWALAVLANNKSKNKDNEQDLSEQDNNIVFWYERLEHSVRLNMTLLNAATQVGQLANTPQENGCKPWIFLSATLAHAGTFTHAQTILGLSTESCDTLIVQSPFNYAQQGRLFIPNGRDFPAANTLEHALAVASHVGQLASVLGGRIAVLCTSRKAVLRVSEALQKYLKQWSKTSGQPSITVLSQLEHGRAAMLEHFRSNPRAILVGASSLWEGLDLPGDLLNAVVIDKIPFAQPDDPILTARLRASEAIGQSPFYAIQIPEASLALKQGTGRLIRTEVDWGVVSVLDTRLRSASYGKQLLQALPNFTVVNTESELVAYCEAQLLDHTHTTTLISSTSKRYRKYN